MIVPGALMIEPTESESKEELDLFIDAMRQIAREAEENPATDSERAARHPRLALDEVGAARKPVLRWKPNRAVRTAASGKSAARSRHGGEAVLDGLSL